MTTARCLLIALGLLSGAVSMSDRAAAAVGDVGVGISMSPDAARVIRDWRRANGLPQPPETDDVSAQTRNGVIPAQSHRQSANAVGNPVTASRSFAHRQLVVVVLNAADDLQYPWRERP